MYKIEIITTSENGEETNEHFLFNDDSIEIKDGFLTFMDDGGVIHSYNKDSIYRYSISEEK